jgi:hypothetical protein
VRSAVGMTRWRTQPEWFKKPLIPDVRLTES